MSQRIDGFDVVKAVAILFVVIGHTWRGLNTAGMIPDAALFARIDAAIYLFHMPVFFFLSGLFFSARRPLDAYYDTVSYKYLKNKGWAMIPTPIAQSAGKSASPMGAPGCCWRCSAR